MLFRKKIGGGVPFARKKEYEYEGVKYEADIKNGDIVTILNEGVTESGQWGDQHNFKIKTRNGEKKIAFNQATINVLIDEFGEDSLKWINKDVKVLIKKAVVAGEKREICYFISGDWKLDEYGELVKSSDGGYVDAGLESIDIDNI